ncbi:MAG TPA: iron-containing alcohol dehydrogenase [Anaerolineae bacterium]|nr:iron-containing alcohol dehydrogenase [Anaerolineae bacterium]
MRFEKAEELIREFKQDRYTYGTGVLNQVGRVASELGNRAALVHPSHAGSEALARIVVESMAEAGVELLGQVKGAAANAPRQDVYRIAMDLKELNPDVIVCLGGGSTIDATKAAEVLRSLGGEIADYFGSGRVTDGLRVSGTSLTPLVAVQTAASSAAHLTKYSNITDLSKGQKKLIVDEGIVPTRAVFDYGVTTSMSPAFTADGAWDGLSHCLEVLYGAVGHANYEKVEEVAREGIGLVVEYAERAVTNPEDAEARSALGYATDLGGYAIMLGGTSGPHLTSFSLVDILSHGRACGILNPYYAVLFAPQVETPLRMVGRLLRDAGFTEVDLDALAGRRLGVAVARAMMALSERVGFPTTLGEIDGFSTEHIQRALTAAKDPQLRMKLENMPVPLSPAMVDEYMGSVLEAAREGDLSLVRNVRWPPAP